MMKRTTITDMEKLKEKRRLLLLAALLLLSLPSTVTTLYGQTDEQTVTGVVTDDTDGPVVGATVLLQNSAKGVVTDLNGRYKITAPRTGTLVISYIGLKTATIEINGRTRINIKLEPDLQLIDELVVVGYGTQRRGSITGAVSSVKGEELTMTKSENPQNMLTGRVPGVRVWQKSSEPGTFNNSLDIRGMGAPLIIIDGVPRSTAEFQRMNPTDIEDISVLKDASAAIYGVRAANGVLLVTTKKGRAGKANVTYNGSYTIQSPIRMPTLADPFEAMTLYNEMSMNNINGGSVVYKEEDFEAYRNGTRKTTDWNNLIFTNHAPQTQHDISISGGSDRSTYYISMGYFYQEGIFKSRDLKYNKFNLRSNLSTEIAKGLKLDLNLNGVLDNRESPYTSSVNIIRNYWAQGVLFPAYADEAGTLLNYDGLDLERNTVAMMTSDISGHRTNKQKYFQSSATLSVDFGQYTPTLEGLTARAMFSYDYRGDNNEAYRKEYYQYAYDENTKTFKQKLFNESSPSHLRREFYEKSQMLGQFILDYKRQFEAGHDVEAMLGWEGQKRSGDNFYAARNLAFTMPYLLAGVNEGQVGSMNTGSNDLYEQANQAIIGRFNYGYKHRYLLEAQFRYDGSSLFAKGHRWGFFPSISGGWTISEEPFVKENESLDFIDILKLRSSYGILGDDGELNYDWAMGYTYPATSGNIANGDYNQYSPGYVFGGEFIYAATPLALPNEDITWFRSKTFNIGLDLEAWNGLLGLSLDYFNRHRTGQFARRSGSLPTVVGATAPRENLDSDRQFGVELVLSHRNQVGDLYYDLKGIATITRRMHLVASEKGPWGNSYDRWRHDNLTNRYQGIQFGYTSAGRYTGWEDIWSYPIYKERDVLPGDYKYEDWNGDGEINDLDEHPFAFDQTPWLQFSLNTSLKYKSLDFNLLLQGSALGSMEYREPLHEIWGRNGGGALKQYLDRWHPTDPKADLYDPATTWVQGHYSYTGRWVRMNSEFNRVSTAYLRLKSIELGYQLPELSFAPEMRLRVFANAYNLLTLTKVKFVDPEHPDDDLGRMYPLNKTYTLGLSLSF